LRRRTLFLLTLITAAVVFIFLISMIIFACVNSQNDQEPQAEEKIDTEEQIEILQEDEPETEPEEAEAEQNNAAHVSYTVSRPLSGLSGRFRGLGVNVSEIDPVNFVNPDPEVLKQMGVEQYLISYFSGEQFYRAGNYDRALTEYNASIRNNNEFIESYISRGNAYLRKRDYNRAIEDYSRAIRLDGGRAELYNYRGFARSEIAARGSSSEFDPAIEDFTRAISLNRNYVDALVNRSHAFYRIGNYDRVIEDCDQIIRLEPANAVIWNRRGSARYAKEDDDRAIRDFSEAIRLNPNYAAAYSNRAKVYQVLGNTEKANADLEAANKIQKQ